MATVHTSIVARNAMLNGSGLTAAAAGGKLDIYSGSMPATPETAASGTKLASFTLGSPAFGAAASGVITANAIAAVTGLAANTAGWARLWESDEATALQDYDVTATGGGGAVQLDYTAIVLNGEVTITSYTITLGQ